MIVSHVVPTQRTLLGLVSRPSTAHHKGQELWVVGHVCEEIELAVDSLAVRLASGTRTPATDTHPDVEAVLIWMMFTVLGPTTQWPMHSPHWVVAQREELPRV